MTDSSGPDRVVLRYTGDEPLALFGGVYSTSYHVQAGTVFEVDAGYGTGLLQRDGFEAATADELAAWQAEPHPADDEPGVPDPLALKGDALKAAVDSWNAQVPADSDRFIPTTMTADEKRERLAGHLGHTPTTEDDAR